MRESPLLTLIRTPWWLNLMIGLGLMSLGELLKRAGGPLMLIQRSFGDGLQLVSVFFVVLALASFLIGASNEFSGETGADTASRVHVPPPRPAQPPGARPGPPLHSREPAAAPPPPPPPKKKYTERDFMPPAMRHQPPAGESKENK